MGINGQGKTEHQKGEGGGIGFLINNEIKIAITTEQQENTNTEIMWIRIQLKRKETLFIGLFYGKQERRNNNATLDKEFKIIERHLYQYIANNQSHILLLGDFNAKVGNGEQTIPNDDPTIIPNGKRLINLTNNFNLKILNKSPKCKGKWT